MSPAPSATSWNFMVCDSLEKVFIDAPPRPMNAAIGFSVFLGESADFQLAFNVPDDAGPADVEVCVDEASSNACVLREVVAVPCQAVSQKFDAHYLKTDTGRYPDLLRPLEHGRVKAASPGWHSVWVEMRTNAISEAGPRPVTVTASVGGEVAFEQTVLINVLPRHLPDLPIEHTQWFHLDALADYYDVPVFSEEHWRIIERFMASAERLGVNTMLTPVWTPPLDTAVGSYRTPVQLVDITKTDGRWSFEFSRLRRWIELCRSHGIVTLEIAHLFSQWDATATPAIYATVDGQMRRIFGWDVPADDPRYQDFLSALIPCLVEMLSEEWNLTRVCFHISDEPHGDEQRASYRKARAIVAPLLRGLRVVDALSDIEFYTEGLVRTPVVANNAISPFLKASADPLWTYYCVAQQQEVSNRFITLPSVRNRILAPQIFKENVRGFLHWGFNFYYSELSASLIDPFHDTTAGGAFPGGDSFIVYPGDGGIPLESIRYRVLANAMNDLKAMALLESLRGRAAVLQLIDPDGSLTFDHFNYDADEYRRMRERINAAITSD